MGSLVMRVIGYFFLRYIVFFGILYSTSKDIKTIKSSDFQSGEDWFYFIWLFFVPVIVEAIVLGLPMAYGLNKMENANNKLVFYLLFLGLFVVELLIGNWLYGTSSGLLKIGISLVLFLAFFWKRLF